MDANGDGIGDIQGIISKLDYLKELGVDVIWVGPIYPSPNDDNGYDIRDYQGISAEFGTMKDFDELLVKTHEKGMRLIMDLVINHTSDEHTWFIESRSSKNNPYRDYYIWHPGKNGQEPNNWESIFGGSAWEYDEKTGEYYMHVFSKKQPDLNWENPEVRNSLYEMINWWLDKGIDGFRVDAISHIKKVPGFPDLPNPHKKKYVPSYEGHMNRKGIHDFLKELKEETFSKYDIMTVGEANGVSPKDADAWVGEKNGKFDMIFQFEHLDLWGKESGNLDLPALKTTLTKWQEALDGSGWNALFMENHDQPRSVSNWGDVENYWKQSATCLATLYFLMQGTPYIYQGQEIGMTNFPFTSVEQLDDIKTKQLYREERKAGNTHAYAMALLRKNSRENSRTPMQWNDEKHAGFSEGTPWKQVNPNYKKINVEAQRQDPDSILNYYKKLIQLRKEHAALVYGSYRLLFENDPQLYVYERILKDEKMLIVTNLFPEITAFQHGKELGAPVLTNGEVKQPHVLQPFEARVYKVK
jgi:glycosidase